MLSLKTAIIYPATCLLEGTNYSEARGTMEPFEVLGAPWVDREKLAEKLNAYNLPGVRFNPRTFIPDSIVDGIKIYPPKFLGEKCEGVEIVVTDREKFESAKAGVYILHALLELYPDKFEWRNARMDGLLGTTKVREQLQAGVSPGQIVAEWDNAGENFRKKREKYLLY